MRSSSVGESGWAGGARGRDDASNGDAGWRPIRCPRADTIADGQPPIALPQSRWDARSLWLVDSRLEDSRMLLDAGSEPLAATSTAALRAVWSLDREGTAIRGWWQRSRRVQSIVGHSLGAWVGEERRRGG